MKYTIIYYLIFFVFLCGGQSLAAQDLHPRDNYFNSEIEEQSFSDAAWKDAIAGIDYSGEFLDEEEEEDEEGEIEYENAGLDRERSSDSSSGGISQFWASLLKVLIVLTVIGMVAAFAYYALVKGLSQPRNRKIKTSGAEFSIEKVEEAIMESDLDRMIRESVERGEFGMAIRLYYLNIIKELSLKKHIRWKRDKTNRDYLNELGGSTLAGRFREMTRIFERIWYGNSALTESDYRAIRPLFEEFIQSIQPVSTTDS